MSRTCTECGHAAHTGPCMVYVGRLGEWTPPSETVLCGCMMPVERETPAAPSERPEGERFLLNAYGRECYDLGFKTGRAAAPDRAVQSTEHEKCSPDGDGQVDRSDGVLLP